MPPLLLEGSGVCGLRASREKIKFFSCHMKKWLYICSRFQRERKFIIRLESGIPGRVIEKRFDSFYFRYERSIFKRDVSKFIDILN